LKYNLSFLPRQAAFAFLQMNALPFQPPLSCKAAPAPQGEIHREQIYDLCDGCISLSNAEGLGTSSFALILRAVDDHCPIALLALMDTLAASLIILAPPNVIYEICPFLFFLFPKSGHRYHLLFYCSDLVHFFEIFADISEENR